MTVQSTTRRNDYIGNGATATYTYSFRIFAATDLLVTKKDTAGVETTLVYPTDYSVTGVGLYSGGSITLTAGVLATNHRITIRRRLPLTQDADIRNQGGYYPDVVENALDRLDMIALQHQDEIDRAIKLPETESTAVTLPTLENRASKFLAFDAAGLPIGAAGTSANLGPVSAFINTLLDDADAATARTTLAAVGLTNAETISGNKTFSGNNTYSGANTFGAVNYAVASGVDTYLVTLSPAPSAYVAGAEYRIMFGSANTLAAPTLNINSLGAKTIKKEGGSALVAGNIPANHAATLRYNGTDLILLNPKYKHRGCLVYQNTASQPCASGANVKMSYDAESYDTDAIHDNAVNPTRLTVPAGVTKIKLWASGNFLSNGTGRRSISFYKNNAVFVSPGGTTVTDQANTSVVHYVRIITPVIAVVAGDYFEAVVYQNSGVSLDIQNQQMSMEIIE